MAVAVKNPETTTSSVLPRLPVSVLLGVAYVIGSLAVLVWLIPKLWWEQFGFGPNMTTYALLYLAEVLAGCGLAYVGLKLLGSPPIRGLKAGIFVGLLSLLVVGLLTRWASTWFEAWVYDRQATSETVGMILTAVVGLGLLGAAVHFLFLRAGAEERLLAIEDQGWFSATSYKKSQGQRVRRGTIVGLLALVAYGVWTLHTHRTTDALGTRHLALSVPFTGKVLVTSPGDTLRAPGLVKGEDLPATLDRATFRKLNEDLKSGYLRVNKPGTSGFEENAILRKEEYQKVKQDLEKGQGETPPTDRAVEPARGNLEYAQILLLPDVRYTLPLILGVLGLWMAWRIVNLPVFADFLIATEAELNKVSWTTKKRLVQDTIVVLTTVVLMTLFLLFVDVLWGKILSWKVIGVLRLPDSQSGQTVKDLDW